MPGGPDRRGYPAEDRLPWLEEAPREPAGAPVGRILLIVLAALLVIALLFAAARWWSGHDAGGDGGAGLIRAPSGPYKIRPADPGGMEVEGGGSSAYVASQGGDPSGAIDLNAVQEKPVARGGPPAAAPAVPAVTEADPLPADPGGGSIQLGAFSTEVKANAAWKALSQRFGFLAPLTPVIQPARSGDATVYRLRAPAGVNARAMCGRLKVAGETCLVVP